jgi:hypothetical protein
MEEQNGIYTHDAGFNGIFVTHPARITKDIFPNLEMLYLPLPEKECFAFCPNAFHNVFYCWQWQEGGGKARFISPLRYILSAN